MSGPSRPARSRAVSAVVCVVAAATAGLAVALLGCPASGDDAIPPTCWAALGYEVPCGRMLCAGGALAAAAVAGTLTWLLARPVGRRPSGTTPGIRTGPG